jgi:predicted transglutaminase-like cysteine proteinase
MSLTKTLLVILILVTTCFSGCMFLRHTTFSLIDLRITDDNGFPRLSIMFNVSDMVDLTLFSPTKKILFSDTYYMGVHNDSMYLGGYRTTVDAGTYTIQAVDASKNTIYDHEVILSGQNLSLSSVSEELWYADASSVVLHFLLRNFGDIPVYPASVTLKQATTSVTALLPPTVVLPSDTEQVACFLVVSPSISDKHHFNITFHDTIGKTLMFSNVTVEDENELTSWDYHWYFLGSQILKAPKVEWLYEYYKSQNRFDILDYAAYVFDPSDDRYIHFLATELLGLKNLQTDVEKINFIASFVQGIEYAADDPLNESYEYPRYPVETLRDQKGDCEDKAILTAALLDSLGYNVSLLRLPKHMAVGVHLNEPISPYSYYIDEYYFLETTTLHMPLGKIPPEYQGLSNVTVYSISSRPLLLHQWESATRYQMSTGEDYVRVKMIFENIGTIAAYDIEIRGAFYDNADQLYNQRSMTVPVLAAGEKRLVELSVDVPSVGSTTLKTQVYLDGVMVNQRESSSRFP